MIVGRFHWRWAFLVQVPPLAVAWILIFIFVRYSLPGQARTMKSAFKQIDWLGSAALILCISGLLLSLSFRNNQVDRLLPASMMKCQLYTVKNLPWSDPKVWATMTTFVVFLVAFVTVEAFVCPNPVMPLRILSSRSTICEPKCWPQYFMILIRQPRHCYEQFPFIDDQLHRYRCHMS